MQQHFLLHFYIGMDGVTEAQREQIRGRLIHNFKGYTETLTFGGWFDGAEIKTEPAMKVEIITAPMDEDFARLRANDTAYVLRLIAKQQAVLWTLTPVISGMSEAQS